MRQLKAVRPGGMHRYISLKYAIIFITAPLLFTSPFMGDRLSS